MLKYVAAFLILLQHAIWLWSLIRNENPHDLHEYLEHHRYGEDSEEDSED